MNTNSYPPFSMRNNQRKSLLNEKLLKKFFEYFLELILVRILHINTYIYNNIIIIFKIIELLLVT